MARLLPTILLGGTPSGAAAYTLTASPGGVTLAGVAATLLFKRRVISTAGTVTAAGVSAYVNYGRKIVSTAGSATYAGVAATLLLKRRVISTAGSATIAGVTASVTYTPAGAYRLTGNVGSATIAGVAATLTYTPLNRYTLTANPGSATFAGVAATLTYTPKQAYTLTALPGSVSFGGLAATLSYSGEPLVTSKYPPPAGAAKPDRKRRVVVEVDGKLVQVTGVKEAQALIKTLRERAKEEAPKLAKKALNKAREVERDDGELPEIEVEPPKVVVHEATDWLQGEFNRLNDWLEREYERAAMEAQLSLLAKRKAFEDDEEDALLALML